MQIPLCVYADAQWIDIYAMDQDGGESDTEG